MLRLHALQRLHVGPVDLELDDGQCISVMGASGSGKSLLLRAIADLDPHQGGLSLDGVAATDMPAPDWRARVTYVAANPAWWSPRVADHFRADMDCRALEALGMAAQACTWPVARLSTGERQRLGLLRAIRPGGRVLLLDEPTSGLDPANVDRVEQLLRAELAAGLAIVMVTHDAAQARRLASRRYQLRDGRLVEEAA